MCVRAWPSKEACSSARSRASVGAGADTSQERPTISTSRRTAAKNSHALLSVRWFASSCVLPPLSAQRVVAAPGAHDPYAAGLGSWGCTRDLDRELVRGTQSRAEADAGSAWGHRHGLDGDAVAPAKPRRI